MSFLRLVKIVRSNNPGNYDEAISQLNELAKKTYFVPYKSFDIQLKEALDAQSKIKEQEVYHLPLSSQDKIKYTGHLEHLVNNLQKILKDRLINYICAYEFPLIVNQISNIFPSLKIKILEEKEKIKYNGFVSSYYILEIDSKFTIEVQTRSETRKDISDEGNAAHNLIPGKAVINIADFFERNPDSTHPFLDISEYIFFLQSININDTKKDQFAQNDLDDLNFLNDLIEYAKNKIRIKDFVPIDKVGFNTHHISQEEISFYDYMKQKLNDCGAYFISVSRRPGSIENNQAQDNPQDKTYMLEQLIKGRTGLSILASLLSERFYFEIIEHGDDNSINKFKSSAYSERFLNTLTQFLNKKLKNINFYPDNPKAYLIGDNKDESGR